MDVSCLEVTIWTWWEEIKRSYRICAESVTGRYHTRTNANKGVLEPVYGSDDVRLEKNHLRKGTIHSQ